MARNLYCLRKKKKENAISVLKLVRMQQFSKDASSDRADKRTFNAKAQKLVLTSDIYINTKIHILLVCSVLL